MTASAIVLSRLPVGSSAHTIAGSADQSAGDRDPLLLAARHLVRLVGCSVAEPDPVEHVHGAPSCVLWRRSPQEQRQLDVLDCVEHRDQVERLEDEAHGVSPVQCPFRVAHGEEIPAVDQDVAAVDVVETREAVEHRGLP